MVSENFFRALKFSDITPYVLRLQVLLPHKVLDFLEESQKRFEKLLYMTLIVFENVVYLTKLHVDF